MDDPAHHPPTARGHRARSWRPRVVAVVAVFLALGVVGIGASPGSGLTRTSTGRPRTDASGASGAPSRPITVTTDLTKCPWLEAALDRNESSAALAALVVARMNRSEKLGEIVLQAVGPYENADAGVPRLCIPSLTLQDGPQGLAFGATQVTQLPSPLGIAATFDPSVAHRYGQIQGAEAAGQGIDVVQGPNLNILRIPQNGRAYEGYGEDPLLVSEMGVADIRGIQGNGVMAQAKHFAVYSQETDRLEIDDQLPARVLDEIYLPPFEAAVRRGHVASVMCAYPKLNGTFQCQNPALSGILTGWGFAGFVRSDLGAVHDPLAALASGTDLIKPSSVRSLGALTSVGRLPTSEVDAAVTRVLTQMFAYGMVGRRVIGRPGDPVATPQHASFAMQAAQRSAVLLKDTGGVLPLSTSSTRSIAVIGADAGASPVTSGHGSSQVTAPFVSLPLQAIERRAGTTVVVRSADGGSTTGPLPPVPTAYLTPASGSGHGLTFTLTQTDPEAGPDSIQMVQPTIDTAVGSPPPGGSLVPGGSAQPSSVQRRELLPLLSQTPSRRSRSGALRSQVVLPSGWSDVSAEWTGTLTPPRTGLYTLALQGSGAASLTLDGQPAVSDTFSHARGIWSQTVPLVGGHPYRVRLSWEPVDKLTPSGETAFVPSALTLGWSDVGDSIAKAADLARRSKVAVVFVGDYSSEAFDKPTLQLPGDENALIEAVAAANPHTVVVLNTGGPVLMPWLDKVAAVLEAWYPGEQDGTAVARLLFGDVDPSGHLPVTFPTSDAAQAVDTPAQWPGAGLTSVYSEGLRVGYRYDHATGTQPLFPFGFGLSYTTFTVSDLRVARSGRGYAATVTVADTGNRAGIAVPQAYLTFPASAGEPPGQLVAFRSVRLRAHRSARITLSLPPTAFTTAATGSRATVAGVYTLAVGQSSSDLPLSTSVTVP